MTPRPVVKAHMPGGDTREPSAYARGQHQLGPKQVTEVFELAMPEPARDWGADGMIQPLVELYRTCMVVLKVWWCGIDADGTDGGARGSRRHGRACHY
jgi:hypothetical protein